MILDGHVLVNGRGLRPGQKLPPAGSIEILEFSTPVQEGARLIRACGDYFYLHKPAGMHSASLAGRNNASLEARLPQLLPPGMSSTMLLQRLDYGTSGIVCAAATECAGNAFRQAEAAGRCHKYYLALVEGFHYKDMLAKGKFASGRRRRVSVLADGAPAIRQTAFVPLWHLEGVECNGLQTDRALTLVLCHIFKGQRHQIRAHAADLGFPLAGDALYGSKIPGNFCLHNFLLDFDGDKTVDLAPDSFPATLPKGAKKAVLAWLAKAGIAEQNLGEV